MNDLYKTYVILALFFVFMVMSALIICPSHTDNLFSSNGFVETSGMIIAAVTAILAIVLAVRGCKRKEVWGFWTGLAALSLFYIGESMSWGEKLFNLSMPVVSGIKFDALHDILSVSIGMLKETRDIIISIGLSDTRSIALIVSLVIGSLAVILYLISIISRYKDDIIDFFTENLKKPPFLFLFTALVMIFAALIIDDDNLVNFPHKEVVDEGLELLATLAFLFSGLCGLIGRSLTFTPKNQS